MTQEGRIRSMKDWAGTERTLAHNGSKGWSREGPLPRVQRMAQDCTRDGLGSTRMVQRRTMAQYGTKDGLGSAGMVQRRTVAKDGTKDGLGRARIVQRSTMAKDGTKDGLGSTRKSRERPWPT
jgi:hypothetical protein